MVSVRHSTFSLLFLAAVACATSADAATPAREVDLKRFFQGVEAKDATFVLLDGRDGSIIRYNAERARTRFVPASTFKIVNSIIALETGVVRDAGHLIRFDPAFRTSGFWAKSWSRDHTLRSAMQNSVYWYYQQLARDIGSTRMQRFLDHFKYGNGQIGGGIDRFWLHGDLRVSADEQVDFLSRMYGERLGVSRRTTRIVKEILLLEEKASYRLSGKTGTADVTPTRELAWLVGYVERGEDTFFFALNVEGEQVWEQWGNPGARLSLVRRILQQLDVIPRGSGRR